MVMSSGVVAEEARTLRPAVFRVERPAQLIGERARGARCRIRQYRASRRETTTGEVADHARIIDTVRRTIIGECMCANISHVSGSCGERGGDLALQCSVPGVHRRQAIVKGTRTSTNLVRQ